MRPAQKCFPRIGNSYYERQAKTDRRVEKSWLQAPSFHVSDASKCAKAHFSTKVKSEPYGQGTVFEPYDPRAVPRLSLCQDADETIELENRSWRELSRTRAKKWLLEPFFDSSESDAEDAMRMAHAWQDSLATPPADQPQALPDAWDVFKALSKEEGPAQPALAVAESFNKTVTLMVFSATHKRHISQRARRRLRATSRTVFAAHVDTYSTMPMSERTKAEAIATCGILFGDKSAVKPCHYHTLHRWVKDTPKAVVAVSRESPMWPLLTKQERKSGRTSVKALKVHIRAFYTYARIAHRQKMAAIRHARRAGEVPSHHGSVHIQGGYVPTWLGGNKTPGSFNPHNEDVTDEVDGQHEEVKVCKKCKAHPNRPNPKCEVCHQSSLFERLSSTCKDFGNTDVFRILLKVLMFMRSQTAFDKALILADTAAEWVSRCGQASELVKTAADLLYEVRSELLARTSPGYDGIVAKGVINEVFNNATGNASPPVSDPSAFSAMQSGDPGGISGLIGGWSAIASILSDRRIKQIMTAVCALMSITAAASCGQHISYEFIKSAVEISDNMTRTASPFDRILQGVDHFMSLVYSFATKGWTGLTAWVNPSRELIDMEELLLSVTDEVDHFDTLDMKARMVFKTKMDKLKKWYTDNADWMKSASVKDFIMKNRAMKLLTGIRAGERKLAALERGKNRPKPLTIGLLAGSDVGKTTIQYRLSGICLSAAGVDVDKTNLGLMTYYWPPGCEFADGLHHGVACVIFDDIGCIHSAKQPEGDPAAANFHRVANCAPFQPPMAALENKSNIACHPQVCILSSNIAGFGFADTFKVPSIMDRRVNHVVVTRPKPEYSRGGVLDPDAAAKWNEHARLDGTKCLAEDFWEVRVFSSAAANEIIHTPGEAIPKMKVSTVWTLIFPQPKEAGKKVGDTEWAPIEDYYHFLADYAESYYGQQEKVKSMIDDYDVNFDQYFTTRRAKEAADRAALLAEEAEERVIRQAEADAAASAEETKQALRRAWLPWWNSGPTAWDSFQATSKVDPARPALVTAPSVPASPSPSYSTHAEESGSVKAAELRENTGDVLYPWEHFVVTGPYSWVSGITSREQFLSTLREETGASRTLVIDVRALKNCPSFMSGPHTGLDAEVREVVKNDGAYNGIMRDVHDTLVACEAKRETVCIYMHCHGGVHRSVAVAEELYEWLGVHVEHRGLIARHAEETKDSFHESGSELGQPQTTLQAGDSNAAMDAGAMAGASVDGVGEAFDYIPSCIIDENEEKRGLDSTPGRLFSYHPPESPLWLQRMMPALNVATHAGVTVAAAAAAGMLVYCGCARVTPAMCGSLFGSSVVNLAETSYDVAYFMCIPRGLRKFLIAIPRTLSAFRVCARSAIGGVASATKAICNGETVKKAYTWASAPLKKLGEWVSANREVVKMIAAMAAVVTVGFGLWYLHKQKKEAEAGELQAKDERPADTASPDKSPTSPPPHVNDTKAHFSEIGKAVEDDLLKASMPVTTSSQKAQLDHRPQLMEKVKGNTYVIGLFDSDRNPIRKSAGHAVFLTTTGYFVANAHVLAKFSEAAWISFRPVSSPAQQQPQLLSTKNIRLAIVRELTDLVVGKLVGCSLAKKTAEIIDFLPTGEVTATLHVKLISKTGAAVFQGRKPLQISSDDCIDGVANVVMGSLYGNPKPSGYKIFGSSPFDGSIEETATGDCGLPYVTGSGGDDGSVAFCLVGIHTGIQNIPQKGLRGVVNRFGGDKTPEGRELLITPLHGVRDVIDIMSGKVPAPGHAGAPRAAVQFGTPPPLVNLRDYKISNLGIPVDKLGKTVHFKCVSTWLDPDLRAAAGWPPLDAPVTSEFLGTWPGFRGATNTTKFSLSPLHKYIDFESLSERIGVDVVDDKVLPDFGGRTPQGTPKLPAARYQALLPMAIQKPFDKDKYLDFKAAADMYKHRLMQHPEWRDNLFKLTTHEACNGIDGLRSMDALKWSTSAGHPWNTVKTQLFEFLEDGKRRPCPEVAQCIQDLEASLSEGVVYPVFSAQVKDEPISAKKNEKGKFRVFMMSPVDFTVVSRKYLMSFVRCMALFPFTFGAAVGMNCHSEQWTQLAHFLGVGTDAEIFDGDYEDFDKQMCIELLQVVRELIVDLHRGVFSDADLKTMDNILRATYSPVVNFFGTLLKIMSVLPSGNMITTQSNCKANNIYLRYVFYKKHGHKYEDVRLVAEHFDMMVRIITYGDDMVASVKYGYAQMFNCKIVQDVLRDIGVGFTDADKNLETQEFRAHRLVGFLKRTLKRVEIEGDTYKYQYCAPLEPKSIGKMLHYNQASAVPMLDVLKSTLQSVGNELYFQGEGPFNIVRAAVEDGLQKWAAAEQIPLTAEDFLFKPYEYYDEWYKDSVSFPDGAYVDPWCHVPDDVYSVKHVDGPSLKAEMYSQHQTDERMGGRCAAQSCAAELLSSRSAPCGARIRDLPYESQGALRTKENAPANTFIIIQSGDPASLTEFNDSSGVNTETVPGTVNATFNTGGMPGVGQLSDWFNRPILHKSITWTENGNLAYTFNPWKEFWSNAEVVKKLEGYSRMRSKMHVKLVVNSTPFQYSMGLMSYEPMRVPGNNDSFAGGKVNTVGMPFGASLSVLTTRPHVFFYPQLQEEAEMIVPFIYHKNWIEMSSAMDELETLGSITIASVVPLRSAAGASLLQGIEVAIYLWAEDVELSGPSYVLQSGDPMPVRPNLIGGMASTGSGTAERLVLDASNSVSDEGINHMDIHTILDRDIGVAVVEWKAVDEKNTALWMADVCPGYSWSTSEDGEVTGQNVSKVQAIPSAQIGAAFNLWNGDITYNFKFVGSAFHTGRLKLVYDPAGLTGYAYDATKDPRVITKIWDVRESPSFSFTVPWASSKAWLQTGRLGGLMCKAQREDRMWSRPTLPMSASDYTHDSSRCNGTILVSVLNPLIANEPSTTTNIVVTVNMGGVDFMDPVDLDVPISFEMLQSGDPPDLSGDPEIETHNTVPAVGIVPAASVYGGEKVTSLKTLMRRSTKYRYVKLMQQMQTPQPWDKPTSAAVDHYPHVPKINATNTPEALGWSTSLLFPVLPLPPGRLDADVDIGTNTGEYAGDGPGEFIPTGLTEGVMTRYDEPTQLYVNQTERVCTPTAYFSPSYVGWRGSHIYRAKVASVGDVRNWKEFSLCRSQLSLSDAVVDMHTCMPLVTDVYTGDLTTLVQGEKYLGAIVRTAGIAKGCGMLNSGGAGMTQTNVSELPYTDAEFPYYSSYRMHPCGPLANYKLTYKHKDLSWNLSDLDTRPLGATACLRSVVQMDEKRTNNLVLSHPDVQLYHKVGSDFTLYFYLNVPTMYAYADSPDGQLAYPWIATQ